MKKMLFGKRMWFMLIGTLVVFGLLFFGQWFGRQKMNEFFNNMPFPPAAVATAEARTERWQPTLRAVGTLNPINGANLTTEVSGIVDSIRFDSGERVKKDDVILTLTTETDRAQLDSLRAAAQLAEVELKRTRQLVKSRSVSEAEVDRRESELAQARANVAAQKARIEEKILRAPFDGILGIRRVNIGQYVAPGDTIIGLQSLDPLFVNFNLPEQYTEEVREGRGVTIQVDALAGAEFLGKVTAVEPAIDAATRNFMVQATVSNEQMRLRPGMFATVRVERGKPREMIVIPATAISYNPYGNSVYVVKDQAPGSAEAPAGAEPTRTVEQRFVTLGGNYGDLVEIVDGLAVGEEVAINGLLKLRHGAPVMVDNTKAPQARFEPTPPNG